MLRPALDIKAIFNEALELGSPEDRSAYLDRACADHPEARARVEALIAALGEAGGFLEAAAPAPTDATVDHAAEPDDDPTVSAVSTPPPEAAGTRIGPYKLLQPIGEGGMGIVYMAEQERPVRRKVALKVIKPGMDTGQVIARFEAERQALALMNHPNIAGVLDAGTTDAGRPYFVMELVKGEPITKYCDEVRLPPRDRLELFGTVCQAIQHAHQKGIIHRDIKPSNVLVTIVDGKPVPKVIDFGVAKAIDQRLTEKTLFTQHGAIVGTLEYMSPEQAELSAMDVDTRSDIYSLGVLLYELLTGTTPLKKETLRKVAYSEILRRIKEEEPPKPSTRLSATGELPSIAAQRRTEPARLSKLVRGDLDWIVMKSLDKDRTRRYESASGFARDVRRYLEGDPVEAGPPSLAYKLRRLSRKHGAALATVGAFATLLIVAAVAGTVLAVWARRAEGKAKDNLAKAVREEQNAKQSDAEAHAVIRFLQDRVFAAAKPLNLVGGLGRDVTLRAAIDAAEPRVADEFAGQPGAELAIRRSLGSTYLILSEPDRAIRQAERARDLAIAREGEASPAIIPVENELGVAYRNAGRQNDAITLLGRTLDKSRTLLGPEHRETLQVMKELGDAHWRAGHRAVAIDLFERSRASMKRIPDAKPDDLVGVTLSLSDAYRAEGRLADAVRISEEAQAQLRERFGPTNGEHLVAMNNLAVLYRDMSRLDDAIKAMESVVAEEKDHLGSAHAMTLMSTSNLAAFYNDKGRHRDSVALLEDAVPLFRSKLGPTHPETLTAMNNLAAALNGVGRTADAIRMNEEVLKARLATLGPDHPETLTTRGNLAAYHTTAGRNDVALRLLEPLLEDERRVLGSEHPTVLATMMNLALAYKKSGRIPESIALNEQVEKHRRAKLGPDHIETLTVRINLGAAYQAVGRNREAIAMLETAVAPLEAQLGPRHFTTLAAMNNLAVSLSAVGRTREAVRLYETLLDRMKAAMGPAHPLTLTTKINLAAQDHKLGRLAEAESLLRAAHEAQGGLLTPKGEMYAVTLFRLGHVLLDRGRPIEAEPLLREALAIFEKKMPKDSWQFEAMGLLGEARMQRKDLAAAETLLTRSYEGQAASRAKVPALNEAVDRLVKLYESWGKPEKAAEWRAMRGPAELPRDVFARP